MRTLTIAGVVLAATTLIQSSARADPDCAGPNHWAANMTFAQLKNAGVLTNDEVDFHRTAGVQIASQKIGPDLYRQVFEITYVLKNGKEVKAIAVSDASNEECSMSAVKEYRVLGPLVEAESGAQTSPSPR